MKRLLLIGGIIATVLPAMADKDLSDYNLVNDETENPTCTGPEGYTGFENGDVTMAPVFVKNCSDGQYYNATSSTPINTSTYTWSDNKCLDGDNNPVTGITTESDCVNAVYYTVNACENVESGFYSSAAKPKVVGNVLESTTPAECPETFPYSDGDRASATDCYKYCGTGDEHTTVSDETLALLHAVGAEYIDGTQHNNGGECVARISSCADGYELVDFSDSSSFVMEVCERGHEGTCASAIQGVDALQAGTWFAKSDVNHVEVSGTIGWNSETQECSATVTSLKFYDNVRTDTFVIPLGTAGSEGACLRTMATVNAFQNGLLKHYAGGIATFGQICLAKTVNITWTEVENPGEAATCTYGGALVIPDAPEKPNYTFKGWKVVTE